MYRDFVYLDTDRVQSIIAQLEEGLLEQVLTGRATGLEGRAAAAAGVLSALLPGAERPPSKALHDYAFTMALETLRQRNLCFEVESEDRSMLPNTPGAFVLLRGSATILDYGLLRQLAQNETFFNKISRDERSIAQNIVAFPGGPKGRRVPGAPAQPAEDNNSIGKMWSFVDAAMGDAVQVRLKRGENLLFLGLLDRAFLRSDTRDFIFKHGGQLQGGWVMLAQLAQIPAAGERGAMFAEFQSHLQSSMGAVSSVADIISLVVEQVNLFQELMMSVAFPAVAVTPIAVYRELR
ncbi:MAG: hypothetical protein OHK0022_39600 [Roseiflexaceae bacterium]